MEADNSSPREDERQPLLATGQETNLSNTQLREIRIKRLGTRIKTLYNRLTPRFDVISPQYRWVPLLGCLVILFNEAEYMTKQVAVFRAIEAMHCIEYWQERDPEIAKLGKHIPEVQCKAHAIQTLVAQTSAWTLFSRMLCAMIGNIPLGYIADKKGKRLVLVLHKVNVMCSGAMQILVYVLYPKLPIWAMYFTGIPGLIGGNFDLGLAMFFASYTDIMTSEAQRTTLFFVTTAMQYPPQAICPLLGGWLMDLDGQGGTPQAALIAGWFCGMTAFLLTILFFPETKRKSAEAESTPEDTTPNQEETRKSRMSLLYNKLKHSLQDTQNAVAGIGLGSVLLLALGLLTVSIGIKSIDWFGLLQYPVVKLHWRFSQATALVSTQAIITLINYIFILPSYSRWGTKRLNWTSASTSLVIMLWSIVLLVGGSTVMGFADTVVIFLLGLLIYTLGTGLPVAAQAYVSVLIDKKSLARVLASLAVATVGGKVLASALFPKVFAAGLNDGREVMKGLPLFVAAALFAFAGIAFLMQACVVRRSKKPAEENRSESHNTTDEGYVST